MPVISSSPVRIASEVEEEEMDVWRESASGKDIN